MKVIYLGVYRDQTGWGQAAIDYILALDAAGVDVVPRPVKLNDRQARLPARVLELEDNDAAGADAVIQHLLPHQMDYCGHFRKNIGLFASETSHFKSSCWADALNNMDEVWVINNQQVKACAASGVERPVRVVPHATNVARYQGGHAHLDALREHKDRGEFLFYTVGEMVRRKNLSGLLRAFWAEFDPDEPVRLVVKTDLPGTPRAELEKHVAAFTADIKRNLKLHGGRDAAYADPVFLLDRLTDEGVLRLHSTCDCFVSPTYGEAWCIPCFDAMGMGRTPIATACGGIADYLSDAEGWPLPWRPEPVFGVTDTFADLFVGDEEWASPSLTDLRRLMRTAYEDRATREEKSARGIERAYDFSHEAVGLRMKGLLHEQRPDCQVLAGTPGPVRPA